VILAAIVAAVSLAAVKLVILKMLPFDNKSEFQVVVDMPVGTPLERTAAVLRDIGAYLATVPEVTDYEAYAGTASPINFNGLVRQYYLRSGPDVGDIQVNLLDKHQRERKSHEIASGVRVPIEEIAKRHGANVKIVEVPPGPPVMSPIVAEVYGPDYRGQIAVAKKVRVVFAKTPDIVAVDDTVEADAQKFVLRVLQNKAALLGVAPKDIVQVMKMGLSGEDVTPIHGSSAKYEIPVRITLAPQRQSSLDELLKLTVRAAFGAGGSGAHRARKDHLPQGSAAGGVCRRRHGGQARQPALRHVLHALRGERHEPSRGRHLGRVFHQPAR
jgi:multidrug efflux pump subunit AcrB